MNGKKAVVHIHNGILLSYKKECIWGSSNEVDETGDYTEWSKSERKTPIQYINYSILMHIYGIQKDVNDDPICETAKETDINNRLCLDSVGEGAGGMIWKNSTETCIFTTILTTIWPNNITQHIPWGNHNWKRHMCPNVHCSTVSNS